MKFSVLMSLYEREHAEYLHLAFDSIINQTLKPSEVIIVFDGPIGEELEIEVRNFGIKFPNIQVIRLKENVGLGKALNEGLKYCNYDLIARMDTDDISYPFRFEKQIKYFVNHGSLCVLGASVQEFDKTPGDLNRFRQLPQNYEDILKFSKFRNPLNHPSVIFSKSAILSVGSYEHMPSFEDYFLWIKVLNNGYVIENLGDSLLHFRVGNDMVGRRQGWSYFKNEYIFLKRIRKMGFINGLQFLTSMVVKFPLRILPKSSLEFVYKKVLR